ncbi:MULTISPECIES: hydroxymethylpyrimidine/phosphomethylpyrimidine kinase [unclassified Guyparkeria]|uniref:bifunctional hydroxymethylpyrimidine kinase/phosphomethylpyrimidine kinase n=1 Tax=unclassified Guyparkeria TaxID=2626246 RepID=UPI0007338065|nr:MULTISPECIES: hydroxymethylpyrimidine/phosphomethylpyrimidine kinase [unclassified Guyparkeria]KTG17581.1 hydroxymethylpyrimidine/phosphomethylpyrimidine kinase [Guyparkeria sp. XI15]OAE88394.1 hydroxymethylpyrimidine/phosphomethylpyrimidine kinase [Guyparkeria sp. WRN-7]
MESRQTLNDLPEVPVVLAIAGHDPSGGAGIHADIEAIVSQGVHPATAITALTVQDTVNVHGFVPSDPKLVIDQSLAVLNDMPVGAIKIGMLGTVELVEAVATVLARHPEIPVVLDPVLVAGGGGSLGDNAVAAAIAEHLFPRATIATPNAHEGRVLAPDARDLEERGAMLSALGAEYVLLKGGDEPGEKVENWLFGVEPPRRFVYERLAGKFHGSGCTLSSAIAGLIAQGSDPINAVHEALEYTHQTLMHAAAIGRGQLVPHRLFWADDEGGADMNDEPPGSSRVH